MSTRRQYIEKIRRVIYNGQPPSDATITTGLVNFWLNPAIGVAAKTNYKDSIQLEQIGYVNNSFYTVFKNLTVAGDDQFLWKISLPQIPFGIGATKGIETLVFKDSDSNQLSYPVVWMTENQLSIQRGMREIPNRLLAYPQGQYVYVQSTLILSAYTANVTMISGGDATDLDSILNVPDDYIPTMDAYLLQNLMLEHKNPIDVTNDGLDAISTT